MNANGQSETSLLVLVVDDGSVDNTAAQARAAGAFVLSLTYNLGIGGAVQARVICTFARTDWCTTARNNVGTPEFRWNVTR